MSNDVTFLFAPLVMISCYGNVGFVSAVSALAFQIVVIVPVMIWLAWSTIFLSLNILFLLAQVPFVSAFFFIPLLSVVVHLGILFLMGPFFLGVHQAPLGGHPYLVAEGAGAGTATLSATSLLLDTCDLDYTRDAQGQLTPLVPWTASQYGLSPSSSSSSPGDLRSSSGSGSTSPLGVDVTRYRFTDVSDFAASVTHKMMILVDPTLHVALYLTREQLTGAQ
jgi:hypothetical protein